MKEMRIAVVDDDFRWRKEASEIIGKYTEEEDSVDSYESGEAFLIEKRQYDVIFMDIEMPIKDGFDTLKEYKKTYSTFISIILTTHTELARKGYLVDAFRYIDKTNMDNEIEEAMEKIKEKFSKESFSLIGNDGARIKNINIKDILFIETNGRKCAIHTMDEKYDCNDRINDLEETLGKYGFFRCHKSFLINMNEVDYMDKDFAYFKKDRKAYISVRKYMETKRKYIEIKKQHASM